MSILLFELSRQFSNNLKIDKYLKDYLRQIFKFLKRKKNESDLKSFVSHLAFNSQSGLNICK